MTSLQTIPAGGANHPEQTTVFTPAQKTVARTIARADRGRSQHHHGEGMQQTVTTSVTNAGNSKFSLFAQAVLKSVTGVVVTHGTNLGTGGNGTSTAHGSDGYSVVFGSTTAGVIVTGSDAAGVAFGPVPLTGTVPANTVIACVSRHRDALASLMSRSPTHCRLSGDVMLNESGYWPTVFPPPDMPKPWRHPPGDDDDDDWVPPIFIPLDKTPPDGDGGPGRFPSGVPICVAA